MPIVEYIEYRPVMRIYDTALGKIMICDGAKITTTMRLFPGEAFDYRIMLYNAIFPWKRHYFYDLKFIVKDNIEVYWKDKKVFETPYKDTIKFGIFSITGEIMMKFPSWRRVGNRWYRYFDACCFPIDADGILYYEGKKEYRPFRFGCSGWCDMRIIEQAYSNVPEYIKRESLEIIWRRYGSYLKSCYTCKYKKDTYGWAYPSRDIGLLGKDGPVVIYAHVFPGIPNMSIVHMYGQGWEKILG